MSQAKPNWYTTYTKAQFYWYVASYFTMFVMSYYVRMRCTLGICERSGNVLVLIIPGWDRGSSRSISIIWMSRTEIVSTVLNIIIPIFIWQWVPVAYNMQLHSTDVNSYNDRRCKLIRSLYTQIINTKRVLTRHCNLTERASPVFATSSIPTELTNERR